MSLLFFQYSNDHVVWCSVLFSKSSEFDKVNIAKAISVCVSFASHSAETIEVIIVKLGTVTASDMGMHHMSIILTLTFI